MAGTDRRARAAPGAPPGAALRPAVVLDRPQLGENIGAAARAMGNFGLDELRLVAPRDGWPNPAARARAAGADGVLDEAAAFDRLDDALADRRLVLAATARPRDMAARVVGPPEAAAMLRAAAARGESSAVVFGRESSGLSNDDVARADAVLAIPGEPGFSSLNLAMAVLLVAWEWRRAALDPPRPDPAPPGGRAAPKSALAGLFAQLEDALDAAGFFRSAAMRPRIARNLRVLLQRARLSEQEVRTLRGVVGALARPRLTPPPERGKEGAP